MTLQIDRVATVMAAHWRPEGYTAPSLERYPWRWLWDSCFHSIIWAALGDADRAVTELAHVFSGQDELGFVPHIDYGPGADGPHAPFWGRPRWSSITQPPMYGHTVAELARRGVDVPDETVDAAIRGLRFLLDHRRRLADGLVTLCHPWESGADDSPRWDHWCGGAHDRERWYAVKGELLGSIERSSGGAPIANPAFAVAPAGFNALVAFNLRELATVTGEGARDAEALAAALDERWDADLETWVDQGPSEAGSGRVRTLDALLPALVNQPRRTLELLLDGGAYGAPFGPTGIHRGEPSFAPRSYWRGAAWPQLGYLLWLAGADASGTVRGASTSGLAEYWDPDDGTGLGAVPQSWAGLAAVIDGSGAGSGSSSG